MATSVKQIRAELADAYSPVDVKTLAAYRQALRDLPETITNPSEVVWPEPPA